MESIASSPRATVSSFQESIDCLSKRLSRDHPYPRPDLINLSNYLNDTTFFRTPDVSPNVKPEITDEDGANDFAAVHDIGSGDTIRFSGSSTGLTEFGAHRPARVLPSLLFLRGFASPHWLTAVGESYNPSPELYRRHLDFQAFTSRGRDLYSSPALPSASARVFQLTIPTICTRNVDIPGYEPEDLQQARQVESEAMVKYFQQLRNKAKVADSVVRKCLLLSQQAYVVEQTISVEVSPPGPGWHAIVWLDSGKDLCESIQGPWNPRPDTRAWETYFFPVIVHQATDVPHHRQGRQGSRRPTLHQHTSAGTGLASPTGRANRTSGEEWRAAQNICQLPFQYGSHLDRNLARHDALYALSELFRFAASAELQFLNFLHKRIEQELSFVGERGVERGGDTTVLLNLKYIKTQLTAHGHWLAETASILRNRHSLDWPRVDGDGPAVELAERTAVLLLADYDYLLQRAETLSRECEHGMDTLANSSVLQESRRSADMAMTVQRLTIISTVFIPLGFVCSVWGMNFEQLGSGNQAMWWWPVTSAPVALLAYVLYKWDDLKQGYYKRRAAKKGRGKGGYY